MRARAVTGAEVAALRAAHGLEREYVLWTGTREPRKNLPVLLRAFALLAKVRPDLDLVLVGPAGWGDDAEERTLTAELSGRVHVLGRLPDEELAAAYAAAHADYLARRAELGQVPEIGGVSAGGMPTRVKCLHALLGHTLAAGAGVNPIGDRTLEALRERGLWDPQRCFC